MTAAESQPSINKSLLFNTEGLLKVVGLKRLDLDLLYFFQKCEHINIMKFFVLLLLNICKALPDGHMDTTAIYICWAGIPHVCTLSISTGKSQSVKA